MKIAHRIRNSGAAACLLVVAACAAPMSAQQCGSTDWYRLGYRDGDVYGMQAQVDQYAEQCRSAPFDRTAYMAGWRDGNAEFRSRVEKTESP
jgi:hypothetical protein